MVSRIGPHDVWQVRSIALRNADALIRLLEGKRFASAENQSLSAFLISPQPQHASDNMPATPRPFSSARARTLKISRLTIHPPYDQPISGIGDATFVAFFPLSGEPMHVMPRPQRRKRFGGVFDHQIDDLFQLDQAPTLLHCLLLETPAESWRELRRPDAFKTCCLIDVALSRSEP